MKKLILTEKLSLQLTWLLFDWLARHPGEKYKTSYLSMIGHTEIENYCWLCEYINPDVNGCKKCPLIDLWRDPIGPGYNRNNPCANSKDSPYRVWATYFSTTKERRKAARTIADYCKMRIKELNKTMAETAQ